MSTEGIDLVWRTQILPRVIGIHTHPFLKTEPPILLIDKNVGEGLALPQAIAGYVQNEGLVLDRICREDGLEFPESLFGKWYPYASRQIDKAEDLIRAGANLDEFAEKQMEGSSRVDLAGMRRILSRLAEIQRKDRTGFKIIDAFTSDASLESLAKVPHANVVQQLVCLGGQRYKSLYLAVSRK